jgi:hypothetical protein
MARWEVILIITIGLGIGLAIAAGRGDRDPRVDEVVQFPDNAQPLLCLAPAVDELSGLRQTDAPRLGHNHRGGVTGRGLCARRVGIGRLDAEVAGKTVRAREFQPPSR